MDQSFAKEREIEVALIKNQCDQMGRLLFNILSFRYNIEKFPNSIRNLPKYVQNFAIYLADPLKFAKVVYLHKLFII